MAGQTLPVADALLKDFYGPGIVEDLNQEVAFMNILDREQNVVFTGRKFLVPIHLKRNSGVGARPENGTLPSAGNQGFADFSVQAVYNYGKIQFTGQTIRATRNDKGAFAQVAEMEMQGIKNDLKLDLNFQFIHNGNAPRATVSTAETSQTTIPVNAVYANILQEGMVVDIYDSTLATLKYSGLTVQSVTMDYSTFDVTAVTLSSAVTVAVGDVLIRSGNNGYEITGLDAIVGSSTYGGINPANYAMWASPTLANGGTDRNLTESLFQTSIDVARRAGGGDLTYFFTTPGVRRNFFNQLLSNKRTISAPDYKTGFDALDYNGRKIVVDDMAIPNTMYGIDPNYIKIYETDQMGWLDDDGTILHRNLDDTDGVYAVMRWYSNIGCTKRSATVKVSDLTES